MGISDSFMVNLTLSYVSKNQKYPSIYMSSHNEVKAVHRDYDFIYTDGSVLNEKLLQSQLLTITLPLNVFKISLLYFLLSCMFSI